MKKIIGNLFYDTEKAEKIYSYNQRRKAGNFGSVNFYKWYEVEVYKTKKNNYFIHGFVPDQPEYDHFLEEFSEPELMEVMKKADPEKYRELYGIEEA